MKGFASHPTLQRSRSSPRKHHQSTQAAEARAAAAAAERRADLSEQLMSFVDALGEFDNATARNLAAAIERTLVALVPSSVSPGDADAGTLLVLLLLLLVWG